MSEGNPYPKGSARYKLWERREADRRKKAEKTAPSPADISGGDRSNRRKALDDAIEGRRSNQSTDSNNE